MLERLRRGPIALVIFGTFVAIVIFGLIWDYSSLLTEQRIRYEESARRYTEQAIDWIEARCEVELPPSALRSCIFQEIESAEDQQRSERDLDAQESVARSTRTMMWTALIGLVLGVGSVYLIWGTLRETQRMAEITRDVGKRQLRAYVTVTVENAVLLGPDRSQLRVKIKFRNSGQTPAKNIRTVSISEFLPYRPPQGAIPPIEDSLGAGSRSTIAMNDFFTIKKVTPVPSRGELKK